MTNRSQILKLIVILLGLCLGGTAVLLLAVRIFFGGVLQQPTTVEVQAAVPKQVNVDEPFTVRLQLTNIITVEQTLHSVDFEETYLQQVNMVRSSPAYLSVRQLPLTNFVSYAYDLELPADIINRPTVVELTFVSNAVGDFSGVMDVCFEDGTLCEAVRLETAVIEK